MLRRNRESGVGGKDKGDKGDKGELALPHDRREWGLGGEGREES
ncbi:hypothetical protein [Chroococcidiopsis thermalis]|nr:hypothetical protein [Chroococcidiopsis thermalis]